MAAFSERSATNSLISVRTYTEPMDLTILEMTRKVVDNLTSGETCVDR